MPEQSFVNQDKLKEVNAKVHEKGFVDREHLLEFLAAINTNDSKAIVAEVNKWLTDLHNDSDYPTVRFPKGHIDDVLGDLDSYGRVQPNTILQYKQNNSHILPPS